jgi:hypothetical protein
LQFNYLSHPAPFPLADEGLSNEENSDGHSDDGTANSGNSDDIDKYEQHGQWNIKEIQAIMTDWKDQAGSQAVIGLRKSPSLPPSVYLAPSLFNHS